MLGWLRSSTYVHLCAALLIASCNAEWKWVQRLLSGEPLTIVVVDGIGHTLYSSHVTHIDSNNMLLKLVHNHLQCHAAR